MILLVAATQREIQPLLPEKSELIIGVPFPLNTFKDVKVELLVTGVGPVATTLFLSKAIETLQYDLIVNIGIAGVFSPELNIGDVVVVSQDTFADFGVDNKGEFVPAYQAGLVKANEFPFENGELVWRYKNHFPVLNAYHEVTGITVSMATGSEERVKTMKELFSPEIETMESAAVFYTCIINRMPFFCLRSISNRVEPRDVKKWNMPLAVEKLCESTVKIIEKLNIVY
ncbi:MAG TPA: futalosine hydrolase [Tenuifilaceae bacterium]|nr:futalosine hydrolase [Tenuifilaceae bacterium]HPE17879.1 futalosine hydrolase [Tenuifilaceae bacterium]HPJ45355.1 futalosine hydrolase [Tenuifilaceae bacterium]HPQ33596.1 futalosine hydrolase [Tenuifilaceae bacterium]HRX67390.1 futalosine hydrolase [Tenuifilaceae bacterium]